MNMRIFFIGQKGIPSKSGGVEKHVEELSARLAKQGHEVFVYTRPNYTKPGLKKYKGVNLISLPNIATKHLDAISHTFMACIDVLFRKADVVHFHSIGPSSLLWIVKILKPGTSVIATFHARCYFHKKWGVFARSFLKFGEYIVCNWTDRTITVSRGLNKYVEDTYNRETAYIPNGVELPECIQPRLIKKWGLKKNGYVLAVSRLVRHKGLHTLISAYNQIETDKKLVIVGGGVFTDDYVVELKKLAGDNKNIIFTGQQSGRALKELFTNAHFFVQPSESEGLSIAILEAMSYKKAVLASDIKENKEAIGKTGIIFKVNDIDSLKRKLQFVLRKPALIQEKGKLGRKRVEKFYNWADITHEVAAVYRAAAAEKYRMHLPDLKLAKRFFSIWF